MNRPKLEKDIERKVVLWAKNNNFITYKLHGNNQWGIPDRLFGYKGNIIFIEFKRPVTGGVLSFSQKTQQRKLESNGFHAKVFNDYDNCVNALKEWKRIIDTHKGA